MRLWLTGVCKAKYDQWTPVLQHNIHLCTQPYELAYSLTRLGKLNKTFHPLDKLHLLVTDPRRQYWAPQSFNNPSILRLNTFRYFYPFPKMYSRLSVLLETRARAITLQN